MPMRPWIVLGAVFLLLLLVSSVRVGGELTYSPSGLLVQIRIGFWRLTVYPLKRRENSHPPKEKPRPPWPPAQEGNLQAGSLGLLRELLPLVAEAAGQLRRKLRVDRLDLKLVLAAGDPAAAALAFGGANAALGMIFPPLEQNFHIRTHRIQTAVDFDRKTPAVNLHAIFTMTIRQGFAFAFHLGRKALPVFLRYRQDGHVRRQEHA